MKSLHQFLARGETLVAPGATDALSAKLIEAHGFECVYIGSYATAASRFALPDTGLLQLEQLGAGKHTDAPQTMRPAPEAAARIRAAVDGRRNPDFLIVATRAPTWFSRRSSDPPSSPRRAGASASRPWRSTCPRRRLDEHRDAAIVLYYAFSILVQYGALERARGFQVGRAAGRAARAREVSRLLEFQGAGASLPGR